MASRAFCTADDAVFDCIECLRQNDAPSHAWRCFVIVNVWQVAKHAWGVGRRRNPESVGQTSSPRTAASLMASSQFCTAIYGIAVCIECRIRNRSLLESVVKNGLGTRIPVLFAAEVNCANRSALKHRFYLDAVGYSQAFFGYLPTPAKPIHESRDACSNGWRAR